MERAFIGIGSNIEPSVQIPRALELLSREAVIRKVSTFYSSDPLDRPEQPRFYNGVVEVQSSLPPRILKFEVLREIEAGLGRERKDDRCAPRPIDLDILLYGDQVLAEEDLIIPDPEIAVRPFLALPLFELFPEGLVPGSGKPLREIAASFKECGLLPLVEFTKTLRERFV